jgi:tetratricopeptide (TPR) repeat protein
MWNRYHLANCLSKRGRKREAIEYRRIELDWCRKRDGNCSLGTITSINGLAIDLREIGEVKEAEALFREVVEVRTQVLEPDDFQIGLALGGLARTLEQGDKLEESLIYSQQALDHRKTHEGFDEWCTNRERFDLASVLEKLGRHADACTLLTELLESMSKISPDHEDRKLISEAEELLMAVQGEAPE